MDWARTSRDDEVVGGTLRPRRRRWLWIGIAAVALLIAIVFAMRLGGTKPDPAAAGGGRDQALPHVSVTVPGRVAVAGAMTATGTLGARVDMPVGVSGEGGTVDRVLVQPGDWVRAGQVLATIDRGVQIQQAAQLAAQIRSAQANADLAQSQLDRAMKLVDRGFISRADIDQKTAARDAARAQVSVARAQLGETQARIARLNVKTPYAGLVLARSVEPGQVVSSASGALFRVAREGEMELLAQLPETDLARLRVGMPARVTPVGSESSFAGRIWQVAPIISQQTRQGIARIAVPYAPALRPGGFAQAAIQSGTVDAPLLPESAVLSDDRGNYVYVVQPKNTVERRPVKVGSVTPQGVTILSGLTGQERVVVSAGAFLNPGDKIVPQRVATGRG